MTTRRPPVRRTPHPTGSTRPVERGSARGQTTGPSRRTKQAERAAATAIIVLAAFAVVAALGVALPVAGLAAAAVLGLTAVFFAASYEPAMLAVLAMPLLCSVQRLGGGGGAASAAAYGDEAAAATTVAPTAGPTGGLSVSDAVLFVVFWVMAFLGPRPASPVLRALLWLTVFYQATTVFTVLVNPYQSNAVEWFHAWLLTAGAIVVGWAAARRGYAASALTLIVLTAASVAVLAVGKAVQQLTAGSTAPVYLFWPFFMHKNVIGPLTAVAAVVVYARPPWLRWPRWATTATFWLLAAGMVASQSRQAIVSVVVVVVLITLRRSSSAHRSRAILVPMFAAVVAVGLTVAAQLDSGNGFDSSHQRLDFYAQATQVWKMNPWFGMGLRWWYTPLVPGGVQPPQAELEMLSQAGIVGLVGFVVMLVGFMVVLWYRLPPEYGTLAVAMVLARVVQGQLDQFWIAVGVSLPLVVVGICVGAYDHDHPPGRRPAVQVVVLDEPVPAGR